MDDPSIYILLALVVLSGFFSGAEIALFSLSQSKVRSLVERGVHRSKTLALIKEDPQRLLITILIGNNLINIGASALATVVATERFGSAGAGIATGIMTFLILFFGEIVPKSIAQRYAKGVSLRIANLMRLLMIIMGPLVIVLDFCTRLVQRMVGAEQSPLIVSEEDVKAMVNIGHEEGVLEEDEKNMIENVFALNDTRVEDVMTPEEYFVGFDSETTLSEAVKIMQEAGHSRYPVYAGDRGQIEGVLYLKDVFNYIAEHDVLSGTCEHDILSMKIQDIARPVFFIPESTRLDDLLKELQKQRVHIAVVVDEHGAVRGLITMEDLLEEIVGEIEDESDIDVKRMRRVDAQTMLIDPRVTIGKLNAVFDSLVPGPRHKTTGWLALQEFGRIPQKGDSVSINDYQFIVEEAEDRRIKKLMVVKTAKARAEEKKG